MHDGKSLNFHMFSNCRQISENARNLDGKNILISTWFDLILLN
jgi:hypothetical protein